MAGLRSQALFNLWRTPSGDEVVYHLYEETPEGAICLGSLGPYTTGYRLFQEKSGVIMPEDLEAVARIQAGQYLEPAIATWAMKRWPKWRLRKSRVYHHHPEVEGWGASLDYWVEEPGKPPVDVKNVDGLVFKNKWELTDGEISNFPFHIVLQLQHQIGCVGSDHSWVLACVGGNELYRGRVERHDGVQAKIATAVKAFWAGVLDNQPPVNADYPTVADVHAFGGADKATVSDHTGNPSAALAARRFARWGRHAKFVDGQIEMMKGKVAELVGENYKAVFDGGVTATWPHIARQGKQVSYYLEPKEYRGSITVKGA